MVTKNGLLIDSTIPEKQQAEIIATLSATLNLAAQTLASNLELTLPDRIVVESKNGKIIGTGSGDNILLFVLAKPDANLGLIQDEMMKSSEKITKLLMV